MKYLIIILLFNSLTLFSQDIEFLDLINDYRIKNGVSKLTWDNSGEYLTAEHTKDIFMKDSLFHSNTGVSSFENVLYCGSIAGTSIQYNKFRKFVKLYYDYDYDSENIIEKDIEKIIKMYIIFGYHESVLHRKNLLNKKVKKVSVSYEYSNLEFESAKVKFQNKDFNYDKLVSFYRIKLYSTMRLSSK